MKKICLFALYLLLLTALNSCNQPNDLLTTTTIDQPTTTTIFQQLPSTIKKIDITHAKALFIAAETPFARGLDDDASTILYQVGQDNSISKVLFQDENSEVITIASNPTGVFPVNDDFFILQFDSDEINHLLSFTAKSYLCRKSDGAVYVLDDGSISQDDVAYVGNPHIHCDWDYLNGQSIQTDQEGNIYYVGYGYNQGKAFTQRLIKIDISDPENITSVCYSASQNETIRSFQITPDGNVIYAYCVGATSGLRVRSWTGALKNLPSYDLGYWVGLDGNIYYDYYNPSSIHRISSDANGLLTDMIVQLPGLQTTVAPWMVYKVKTADRICLINTYGDVIEVDNPQHTPRKLAVQVFNTLRSAGASANYYYLAANDNSGNPSIFKIDPVTNQVTSILPLGEYEVYQMSVGLDDNITFNALKMANGANVIGEIDANGFLTITSETIDERDVISLIRL